MDNLSKLFDLLFPERVGIIAVQNNPKGRGQDRHFATSHEYLVSVAKNEEARLIGIPKTEDQLSLYPQKDMDGNTFRFHELRNSHRQFNRQTRPNLWYPLYVNKKSGFVTLEPQEGTEEVFPFWNDDFEGCWTWGKELVKDQRNLLIGRLVSGNWKIYRKDYAFQNGEMATFTPKTIWAEKGMRTDVGQELLDDVMGNRIFRSPKPVELIMQAIQLSANATDYILDFFSGSGTTAHAVLDLNKKDKVNRKYILVEMGEYFNTIMKPRIQKVMYSKDWKGGKPQSSDGISHIFKYQYLEQYEDTLNNIAFLGLDRKVQETLEGFDDYFLRYMLDYETKESPTRLALKHFENPFDYKLKITTNENEERTENIDLVETFNYLLGIHVERIRVFEDENRKYRVVFGRKEDKKITVIWRNTESIDFRKDKKFVENTILNNGKYERIYVNGDSFISNALPIEPEFKRLMGA